MPLTQAGIAESFPGVDHTLSEDGKGGPPNNGIVLGQYQSRVLDMASAYATLAASGVYHKPHFVQKVVNADGHVLFDATQEDNSGEQRIDKAVADNVTAAMQPIAGYANGHNLAGGRPSAAKTGTNQLGDTDANRDAWMVGFTPSLSTAVWVGTTDGTKPLENKAGSPVYGSGLPSDIWKATMDGALDGTDNESFPKPAEIGGYAGVPQAPPPPPPTVPPAALGDGDPADAGDRARRHDSVRPPDDRARRTAAGSRGSGSGSPGCARSPVAPGAAPGPEVVAPDRRRRFPVLRPRDRTRGGSAGCACIAGTSSGRPAEPGRSRSAQPHRHDRRRAVGNHRWSRRPARVDRPDPVADPAAGDADHRADVPGAGLFDEGGLPADHR